jgi:hypothetical protein
MITPKQLLQSPQFQELMEAVQTQYEQLQPDTSSLQAGLETERESLEDQRRGLGHSLSNPKLDSKVRRMLEDNLSDICGRLQEIEQKLIEIGSADVQKETALNPEVVAEQLSRLSELLDGENAPATNVMLSQHIAAIECEPNGRVVVRSCLLGALANPDQIASSLPQAGQSAPDDKTRTGRRRTRRTIDAAFDDEDEADAANDFAVDLNRYEGLGPEWFTDDAFQIPDNRPWFQAHAKEVAEYRLEHRSTIEELREEFKKCRPTIYKALRFAKDECGIDAMGIDISISKRKNWSRENAQQVIDFFSQPGASMKAAEKYFGKSQPTISKAKKFAEEINLQPREAERQEDRIDESDLPDEAA